MRLRRRPAAAPNPWLASEAAPLDPEGRAAAQTISPEPGTGAAWLAGAHGGAGASTLSALTNLPEVRAGAGSQAVLFAARTHRRLLVVARTHAYGLTCAQRLLRDAASVPVPVAGLALVADAPGRLRPELVDLADLVSGAARDAPVWRVRWAPDLRLQPAGAPVSALRAACPAPVLSVLDEISTRARGWPDAPEPTWAGTHDER